jgi:hypothetical protein
MKKIAHSIPFLFLRVEGAVIFFAAIWFYFYLGSNWVVFLVLFLVPDAGTVGYLVNSRTGALTYNIFHTYAVPLVLGVIGIIVASPICIDLALIWIAHIGFDRVLGYGLKYPTRFTDTHLQRK